MNRWIAGLVVVLALGIIGGAGYWGFLQARPATTAIVAPPTVAVDRGDVQQTIDAPGQLTSTHELMLSSSVGGKIAQINAHPGETVKAGDALAQIDDTDMQSALRKAQADLAGAQAAYDAALTKNSHRNDQIVVAKAALDKATITLQSAQHDYDAVAWRPDIGMTSQKDGHGALWPELSKPSMIHRVDGHPRPPE